MKLKDLKISQKLWISYSVLILIILVIGVVSYLRMASLTDYLTNIKNNRLPDLNEFAIMNTERMIIRSQTLEVFQFINTQNAQNEYIRILDEREKAWRAIETIWTNLLERKRETETGRLLIEQLKVEYQDWRKIYVEIDAVIKELSKTDDSKIKNELYSKYTDLYTKMVPISNKMGATFIKALEHNRDNTFTLIDDKTKAAINTSYKMAFIMILLLLIAVFIVNSIKNTITKPLFKNVSLVEEIANGNLIVAFDISQKDEVGILANALKNMVEKLKEIIGNVVTGADNIALASQQMSSTSQELSQGANEQASSVEEVSSTMEQMTSNIEQNSLNSTQTEKISTMALEGMKVVADRAEQAVGANRVIADKIKIINDIAFQTNILALNAAVEAARAGEHGKGFAVVAAEVRKLAERSKVAADEIVTLSSKSLGLSEETGKKMVDLMPEIEKTTRMVQEIAAASAEQANGATQVNSAVQQLNTVTQQNAAASEELSTGAEELASQAEQLKDLISFFKVENVGIKHTSTRKTEKVGKHVETHTRQTPVKPAAKKTTGFDFQLKDQDDKNYENY